MPGKMDRSAPRPPFGLPGLPVAVRTSRLASRQSEIAIFHAGSGFIWGIPVKGSQESRLKDHNRIEDNSRQLARVFLRRFQSFVRRKGRSCKGRMHPSTERRRCC
jgi:hypothetical protein